jgi:hypothetical protein
MIGCSIAGVGARRVMLEIMVCNASDLSDRPMSLELDKLDKLDNFHDYNHTVGAQKFFL